MMGAPKAIPLTRMTLGSEKEARRRAALMLAEQLHADELVDLLEMLGLTDQVECLTCGALQYVWHLNRTEGCRDCRPEEHYLDRAVNA